MPKSSTSKTLKLPKPSKSSSKPSSARSSTKSAKADKKSKAGKVIGEAENAGITSAAFEDSYRQENLSREFIRQITGEDGGGNIMSNMEQRVDLPSVQKEVPKFIADEPAISGLDQPNFDSKTGLPSGQIEAPKFQADGPSFTGIDQPRFDSNVVSPSGQFEAPDVPVISGLDTAKLESKANLPSGQLDTPEIKPDIKGPKLFANPSQPNVELRQKDSQSVLKNSATAAGNSGRKMIHSTINCHLPIDDEPTQRTKVIHGNMDQELQNRITRHVNKYWNAKNAFPSIYPILLKLEREIGPGWRLDKIQSEKYVHADAVPKSTMNFTVVPEPTMYSIWRQQVPIF